MMMTRWMACVCAGAVVLASSLVSAQSAQELFDKGQALVAKGDVAGGAEALAAAAKAAPDNQDYAKRHAVVKRVVDLQTRLATEKDARAWETIARTLRSFYIREKLNDQAEAIALQMFERLKTPTAAVNLAEAQLAAKKDAEAVKTLATIDEASATPATRALLTIALARTGKAEEAKQVAAKLTVPEDGTPGLKLAVARAYAAAGDAAQAIGTLKAMFEKTPPSQLDGIKTFAKWCDEFAAIAATPEFAKVLETKSTMKESDCSSGSSCSSCPMGSRCPSTGEKK